MKNTLFALLCFACLPAFSSHAQIQHGQVIRSFTVYEQPCAVFWIYPGTKGLAPKGDQVYIGPCTFQRGNATRNDWKSLAQAFPAFVFNDPWFKFEKFPKVLNHTFELTESKKHPVLIINKAIVRNADFYFIPIDGFWDGVTFEGMFGVLTPTDRLDMTISKVSSRIRFAGDLTSCTKITKTDGRTTFEMRVRYDAPNNISRGDAVNYHLIRTRLAFYAKKPDGTWSLIHSQAVMQNTVGYTTESLKIPTNWAIKTKTLVGDIFVTKVQLERSVWTEPVAEVAQWGGWKKIAGGLTSFEVHLAKDLGK